MQGVSALFGGGRYAFEAGGKIAGADAHLREKTARSVAHSAFNVAVNRLALGPKSNWTENKKQSK